MKTYLIKVSLLLTLFILLIQTSWAQNEKLTLKKEKNYYQYDGDFLPAEFHKERRDSLRKIMPDSSVMVFFASPERNRSNDVYYEYHQNPDFYYLTGFREPNAMVVIFKEKQKFKEFDANEILFIPERDASAEVWNGRRLGVEKAQNSLLFDEVKANTDFKEFEMNLEKLKYVFFQKPETPENQDTSVTDNLNGLYRAFLSKNTVPTRLADELPDMLMAQLRQKKTEEEMLLLRRAIDITCAAQNELMKNIQPDMAEYETEALIEYVFKKNGAEYPGFPSIQGSGENSCILHYTANRRPLKNGGLLVSDVGAEYRGYTADVTRTIPPDGSFSEEEKKIYNLVLKAQSAGIEAAKVGNDFWEPGRVATAIIAEGLKKLGIIKNEEEVRKYFMHGTSHYLGLDVHDAGLYMPLEINQVITVEPGIYIAEGSDCDSKWWNIGVRIEDDILITEEGPENLSAGSPRTIEEIESLMKKD